MNFPFYLTEEAIAGFIESALKEDIGDGDHSTLAVVPETSIARARLLVKDDGILAGADGLGCLCAGR